MPTYIFSRTLHTVVRTMLLLICTDAYAATHQLTMVAFSMEDNSANPGPVSGDSISFTIYPQKYNSYDQTCRENGAIDKLDHSRVDQQGYMLRPSFSYTLPSGGSVTLSSSAELTDAHRIIDSSGNYLYHKAVKSTSNNYYPCQYRPDIATTFWGSIRTTVAGLNQLPVGASYTIPVPVKSYYGQGVGVDDAEMLSPQTWEWPGGQFEYIELKISKQANCTMSVLDHIDFGSLPINNADGTIVSARVDVDCDFNNVPVRLEMLSPSAPPISDDAEYMNVGLGNGWDAGVWFDDTGTGTAYETTTSSSEMITLSAGLTRHADSRPGALSGSFVLRMTLL
ncbi:PapG-like protein [Buttiauxella sp. JUb87]|nr:PapG-like protein [Buttiauxella sp. JUb87]